jgi:dihydrofolate reductase
VTEVISRPIVIVAAMGRNRIIGVDNGLPWRMRSDLRQFRAATMGKPMIMGRKTYEAIGRPLPGRDTVVVTRDPVFRAQGVHVVDSLEGAFVLADMLARVKAVDEVIVAGGATVYAEAMDYADKLLITEIDLEPEGDALFPVIDPAVWQEVSRQSFEKAEGDDAGFAVVRWERRPQR